LKQHHELFVNVLKRLFPRASPQRADLRNGKVVVRILADPPTDDLGELMEIEKPN